MGWRDREWAKLDDEELRALYGFEHASVRAGHGRAMVWGAVAVLVLAVGGFAWTQRPNAASPTPGQPVRAVFGTPTSELHAEGPDGLCTELEWVAAEALWRCDSVAVEQAGTPTGRAGPYDGPCVHLVVDQERRRWSCLAAR